MGFEFDVERGVMRVADLTKIDPVMFRGVDCAVLAERYVAFRRNNCLDHVHDVPDVIKPASEPSSDHV